MMPFTELEVSGSCEIWIESWPTLYISSQWEDGSTICSVWQGEGNQGQSVYKVMWACTSGVLC